MIALLSLFLKITNNKRTVFFHWQDICSFALKNVSQKNRLHNFWPTSWPLSLCKVCKTAARVDPELWECLILVRKTAYSPWRGFFSSKNHHHIIFIYLLASFIMQSLQKYPYNRLRVMTTHHFCAQNGAIASRRFLLEKPLIQFSCISLTLSLCKTFKTLSDWIQSYDDVSFLGSEWPIFWGGKTITVIKFSCTSWTLLLCKTSKKLLQWIQSFHSASFLEPKWSIFPKEFFLKNH